MMRELDRTTKLVEEAGARIRELHAENKFLYDRLNVLRQRVEEADRLAEKEEDADGFIVAYHFKTGAWHRLLAEARK